MDKFYPRRARTRRKAKVICVCPPCTRRGRSIIAYSTWLRHCRTHNMDKSKPVYYHPERASRDPYPVTLSEPEANPSGQVAPMSGPLDLDMCITPTMYSHPDLPTPPPHTRAVIHIPHLRARIQKNLKNRIPKSTSSETIHCAKYKIMNSIN